MRRIGLGALGRGLIRRLAALLMALLLMASFYLYALMREDEQTKRSDQWVVAAEQGDLEPLGTVNSLEPSHLAQAMAVPLPLPASLLDGRVWDDSHHGYYIRRLSASDSAIRVEGVRPASASALLRDKGLHFTHSAQTLMGYPLLEARDNQLAYYYLSTELAAFLIVLPLADHQAMLQQIRIYNPQ